jgi:hypothetical protein
MMRFSGELDPMKKFKVDSRLCLLTNRLVSSASKSIDERVFLRSYKESQIPCHLHRKLNPQDLSQVAPLRKN